MAISSRPLKIVRDRLTSREIFRSYMSSIRRVELFILNQPKIQYYNKKKKKIRSDVMRRVKKKFPAPQIHSRYALESRLFSFYVRRLAHCRAFLNWNKIFILFRKVFYERRQKYCSEKASVKKLKKIIPLFSVINKLLGGSAINIFVWQLQCG